MGIKDKIRDVLHGDKDDTTLTTTGSQTPQAPGAYPSDATTVKQSKTTDGRDYQPGQYQGDQLASGQAKSGKTYGHRTTDSGVDFGDQPHREDDPTALGRKGLGDRTSASQEPYWGAMGQGTEQPGTHTGTTTSAVTGTALGAGAGTGMRTTDNSHLDKDLPSRPLVQPGSDQYNSRTQHPGPLSGGAYNTVTGAGSREYQSSGKPVDSTLKDDRLGYQSSSKPLDSSLTDDPRERRAQDNTGRGVPGTAIGLGAAGAAGAAGAGYAATRGRGDEDFNFNDRNAMYTTSGAQPRAEDRLGNTTTTTAGGGVPRSTMIDQNPSDPMTKGRAGPHASDMANKADPRVDSDRDGSHTLGGGQNQSRTTGSSGLGTAAGVAGMGPNHYGPGHEGAKVMHRCVGCGLDNDISQYFRKDAVYRMG